MNLTTQKPRFCEDEVGEWTTVRRHVAWHHHQTFPDDDLSNKHLAQLMLCKFRQKHPECKRSLGSVLAGLGNGPVYKQTLSELTEKKVQEKKLQEQTTLAAQHEKKHAELLANLFLGTVQQLAEITPGRLQELGIDFRKHVKNLIVE
jgi:hypothetical protein